jgi:hypothetical protein
MWVQKAPLSYTWCCSNFLWIMPPYSNSLRTIYQKFPNLYVHPWIIDRACDWCRRDWKQCHINSYFFSGYTFFFFHLNLVKVFSEKINIWASGSVTISSSKPEKSNNKIVELIELVTSMTLIFLRTRNNTLDIRCEGKGRYPFSPLL